VKIGAGEARGDRSGDEAGERSREHGAHSEPREIVAAIRRQRADANLDAKRPSTG
jgi:hypothetical protein